MNRRNLFAFFAAVPLALAASCPPQVAAAGTNQPPVYNHLPSDRVGTRSWYIDRLAEQVLNGAAVCTRDNGALFDFCRGKNAEGVLGQPEWFGNDAALRRRDAFGADPFTGTDHYIYWPTPRKRVDRLALMRGLRAAAWRDESFGRAPDRTFVQPTTQARQVA